MPDALIRYPGSIEKLKLLGVTYLLTYLRERFDILFVCVTLFIGWIVFDLMANTILVKVVYYYALCTKTKEERM
jgi:hypothetical protein